MLASNLEHVATMKVTEEISNYVIDLSEIDSTGRELKWSASDEEKLATLNLSSKRLEVPPWLWAADDATPQGNFNDERLKFWYEQECWFRFLTCPVCGITSILVGSQIPDTTCVDCTNTRKCRIPEKEREVGLS